MTGRKAPADRKAAAARAWDSARHAQPRLLPDSPYAGVAAWKLGDAIVLMPALRPGAPGTVRRIYRDRIIANGSGVCPRCHAIADVHERARIAHEPDCRLTDHSLSRWLDRAGQRILAAAL